MGLATADDAAVYRLTEDIAVIQTVDFFPPMVDDPFLFGQIAAANALSDIYAMGGRPLLALNIVCFPSGLNPAVLVEILRGGASKVKEAGAIIAGGHSVLDEEPKYGLAVTGLVHPQKILANTGAKAGDLLVLTKPLGTGIVNTAAKGDLVAAATLALAIKQMATLNAVAGQIITTVGVNACTDITGFGLLGHLAEMARGSQVSCEIWAEQCPVLPGVPALARLGMIPAGAYNNRQYLGKEVFFATAVTREMQDIMFDPQTSGGLLISLPPDRSKQLLKALTENNVVAAVIGRVNLTGKYLITVQ